MNITQFTNLVIQMRTAQKAYFRVRSSALLQSCKALEAKVDRESQNLAGELLFPPDKVPAMPQEHFEARSVELLDHLRDAPDVEVRLQPAVALTVLAQLHLALRHPGNQGPASQIARRVADALIDELARDQPRIRKLLKEGEDPRYDVAVSPQSSPF